MQVQPAQKVILHQEKHGNLHCNPQTFRNIPYEVNKLNKNDLSDVSLQEEDRKQCSADALRSR